MIILERYYKKFRSLSKRKNTSSTEIQMRLDVKNSQWKSIIVSLPDGFSDMVFTPGMEQQWLDLLNSCKEFGSWTYEKLSKRILNTLVNNGGILLYNKNQPIASAALCYHASLDDVSVLMYVVVKKKFRGLDLGKFMIARLLNVAEASNFESVILKTNTHRVAALHIYFLFGFSLENGPSEILMKKKFAGTHRKNHEE